MTTKVYLGVERGTTTKVLEPLGHLAVFGQTRRAGKTTSLRELIRRACLDAGAQALIFRTGAAEISFDGYTSTPYFRDRVTWQGVETMLWTYLAGEKPKAYRPILMKAVGGAASLEDVHRNIVAAGKKAKNGWLVDRLFELDTYFQEILPWLRGHELATMIYLGERENVVDLEGWPLTVKQLVIASTLEALMDGGKRATPLLVVLPEARNFMPSDSKTPVTRAADRMAREGAKLNLFLWIDSQALTGVDQLILRNFALQLQGVQTSDIELGRVSKAFEVPAKAVRSLRVGDFILHTDDGVRTVHVPLGKQEEPRQTRIISEEESKVDAKERKNYEDRISAMALNIETLTTRVTKLAEENGRIRDDLISERRGRKEEYERAEANAKAAGANAVSALNARKAQAAAAQVFLDRQPAPSPRDLARVVAETTPGISDAPLKLGESVKVDLHVTHEVPDLTIHVKTVRIEATPKDNRGRIAILIADGLFDKATETSTIGVEYVRRGWMNYNPISKGGGSYSGVKDALDKLTEWGFLVKPGGGTAYEAVPAAKARIHVVEE